MALVRNIACVVISGEQLSSSSHYRNQIKLPHIAPAYSAKVWAAEIPAYIISVGISS
jgi:hypothetical protein